MCAVIVDEVHTLRRRRPPIFDETASEIARWLVETGHLEHDGGMLFIGPEAERQYGQDNFMELLAVFTAAPQFVVLYGRHEVGAADPLMLMRKTEGPRVLALGGRAWRVTHIDWNRHRCYVEPSDLPARSLWQGALPPESYELSQAQRSVLLGVTPDVELSKRAEKTLGTPREESSHQVWESGTVIERRDDELWWWTWAGGRGNATLAAALETSSTRTNGRRTTACGCVPRSGVRSSDARLTT